MNLNPLTSSESCAIIAAGFDYRFPAACIGPKDLWKPKMRCQTYGQSEMVGAATASAVRQFLEPSFANALLVIVGGYGSGKSEISVNLARYLAVSQPDPVSIADLDLVNPYFRSREALKQLNSLGIKVIAPQGDMQHADLPVVLPEIRGAIGGADGPVILDVGGDDVGSRV
ncbi:MAG: hypothetical protein ABIJ61_01220, partial [bacterium]